MTFDEFNEFCHHLPASTYIMQWGGSHVWKIGGKVFAIGGWGQADQPAYSFKTSQQNFHFLQNEDGYRPAPYLAARGMTWIQHYDATKKDDDDLKYYLTESHRIVALGLTKKKQRELGLLNDGK